MSIKTPKTNYLNKPLLILVMLFVMLFANLQIQADEFDDRIEEYCKDHSEEECEDFKETVDSEETEYDTLENQLKNAEKLAKLKKQQGQTLTNQLQILNLEMNDVKGDIQSLSSKIAATQKKIDNLEEKIKIKTKNIKENQKSLGEMLRGYHRLNQSFNLSLLSSENGLSQAFSQSDYLSQISTKINSALKIIEEEKELLAEEKENEQLERGKLNSEKSELDKEKQKLDLKKNEKGSLLNRTKGEEANYKALISKIESQMKQLLIDVDSLSVAEQKELDYILKNAEKPKKGLASTNWYYSQLDEEWASEKLGGSRYTIGDSGCAITSIAMVFTYHDEKVDPEDLVDASSFTSQGYIDWSSAPKKFDMKLKKDKYGTYHGNIDWDDVEDLIDDENPVIVYINGGAGGHYVVVHGYDSKNDDFVVHDPYWGSNLLLGTSKKLVSSLYRRTANVDQMIVYKPD